MKNTPDVLLPFVSVYTVVDVRRQSEGSLHRVSGKSRATESLQQPALVVHVCRSTIDAQERENRRFKTGVIQERESVEAEQKEEQ